MFAAPSGCMAHEIWPLGGGGTLILFNDWEDFGVAMKELVKDWRDRNKAISWTIKFRGIGNNNAPFVHPWERKEILDSLHSGEYVNAATVTANSDENS
ncbi:uncharacterized protein METZ01_LOCUS314108 [marine metagenome]|uniref:Uncharacterized protein n=1 Tax=marine metagenome TaxID=408172 RepID=A0A382NJ79_9ZZZZ